MTCQHCKAVLEVRGDFYFDDMGESACPAFPNEYITHDPGLR